MIQVPNQFISRRRRDRYLSLEATSIPLPRLWAVLLSLTNKDSGTKTFRFQEQDDIRQSQNGDSDAYRRLIERYQGHIGKLLWRFTRDRTCHEELVQETFVQAYLSLRTYQAKAPFEHWLSRIATRVGYRFWKEQGKHQHLTLLEDEWNNLAGSDTPETDPQEAAELIHHLLSQLPPRDRLVLTLRYLEQCDIAETARRTGWNVTMVKVQTHRAIKKLKLLAEKADIELEI